MFKLLLVCLSLCFISGSNGASYYYSNKVYKLTSLNDLQYLFIDQLRSNSDFKFLVEIETVRYIELEVAPRAQLKFENWLENENISYQIGQKYQQKQNGHISFDKYYRYAEIQDYLNRLANQYPKLVTLENYGKSYEGRNLTSLYVSNGDGNKNKPIIFIDAGIHAREWIAPAQGLYIIDQVLESTTNSYLRNDVDWVLIPLLNPDGYEYTHTVDRMWRKTRSIGKQCDGVDPNRNFDYRWGGTGSSKDECSNTYAGPVAFSEPETLALSKLISKYADRTKMYLSFHSAAQCFLHPWGYTQELPPNVQELTILGQEAEKAAEAVNGTVFKVGSSANILAFAPGSSRDWAYGVAGIPLAYTMELPPGGGPNRFDMPPERIYGVVTEMFEAVKVFHKYVAQKYFRKFY